MAPYTVLTMHTQFVQRQSFEKIVNTLMLINVLNVERIKEGIKTVFLYLFFLFPQEIE